MDEHNVSAVMENILMMQADMISRISHVEPGCTRLFFRKLREDLADRTEQIIEDIKGLV